MRKVNVLKRGSVFQYKFEIASVDGKRKFKSKSGFRTKSEAEKAGIAAYTEYMNTGHAFTPSEMSYSDYLDYWMKEHCEINLKYHTIEAYRSITRIHVKPKIGHYGLSQITTATLQEFVNRVYLEGSYSKNFMKNILKVLKTSFSYATDVVGFIKVNPALKVKLPRYDIPDSDPAHIFTKEEIEKILNRFTRNHCAYYAFLTAYYTGLRVSEVFALTWDDIDLESKTLRVNKNVLKKNQASATHGRHISGKATTMWYFGTCKTQTSYRTIPIGDTLLNALKEYKREQEENKRNYGDTYMKHYKKVVINPYNNKQEIKILNANAEIPIPLEEVDFVFIKKNGVYEGTDSCKYPFKVIHYELGIPCRFHDFRDTHATKLIESGADIKAVSKRLGHRSIDFTYNIYVRVTQKMENETADKFEEICSSL
ncbi:MAG: tyrosine-type recombinase/integrase [Clostridia bacterium]|nr:tyrosine-type recombinase/integrase [Clostridia bacterium]